MPPQDDLLAVIKQSVKKIPENSILAIASKVVSIWEGRTVHESKIDKRELIKQEADKFAYWGYDKRRTVMTIKNNIIIRGAGIDKSNGNGFYILWPSNPDESARKIHDWIKKTYGTKIFGVVIVDSHSIPLRRGTFGISLGHYGFRALNDYRGTTDLFGKKLRFSQANIVDSLAAAAQVCVGEGSESTPLALITDVAFVKFGLAFPQSKRPYSSLKVPINEDIYGPILNKLKWRKKAKSGH